MRHWRDSVSHYGLWHTLKQLAEAFYGFLRELLPDRRKARFGDLDYDWGHNVDTTRSNVSLRTQLLAALTAHQYFPTEPWLFTEIMQALPAEKSKFSFIDMGSGKGRVLLMASAYDFKRIIGVEFVPEWHRVAEENIQKFTAEQMPTMPITSVCMDARDFQFPVDPLVIYLFNPFPEPVLAAVLDQLRDSCNRVPRDIFVAYRYPEFDHLLKTGDWLQSIAGTEQWAVYRNWRSGDRG
ncbi:MAG TPA: class I SAM-dependent methyltransferase [Candidatus Limnocylindrales bacterium]|nr:class I SAM-dependent methyltransferase [Candidatus Limnocylindrales bacterium]